MLRHPCRIVLVALGLLAAAAARAAEPKTWDGPLLAPVDREEVFEFTRRPSVKKIGRDRYEITFASKGRCDVAVAVEDAQGRIVRHLVCGVLGSNAPAPLAKGSLEQTLVWDGKDDRGRYVNAPSDCRVRVSLGLAPALDKVLAWHPKDVTAGRQISNIAADKDGVYVLETTGKGSAHLRAFDHEGRYVRTLVPVAGDRFKAGKADIRKRPVEDGRVVPYLTRLGGIEPTAGVTNRMALAAGGGRLAMYTDGHGDPRTILRLRTDGTTGGLPMVGAVVSDKALWLKGTMFIALSPDGKWVYVSGINHRGRMGGNQPNDKPPYLWNAVYRFKWEEKGPVVERLNPWLGEIGRDRKAGDGSGKAEDHFNRPEGLATDGAGRLYVCDTGNDRIQVFGPDRKLVESIPFKRPRLVSVNHRTGELFVVTTAQKQHWMPVEVKLSKLGRDRKVKAEITELARGRGGATPVVCVDGWADPPRVWLVAQPGFVRAYADRGGRLELVEDFEQEVRKAGLRPHVHGAARMNRVAVDPVRGHLYYLMGTGAGLYRIDPEGPGRMELVERLGGGFPESIAFGLDGLLYAKHLKFIARLDPGKLVRFTGGVRPGQTVPDLTFHPDAEVPFNYGEGAKPQWGRPFRGALKVPSLPGANGYDNGLCVSPRGEILAFVKNYQSKEGYLNAGRKYESWHLGDGGEKAFMQRIAGRYRPQIFPGRTYGAAELVFRWNAGGELVGEDLIPSLPMASFGIRTDAAGAIYVGVGARQVMEKGLHTGGAVAKFPPWGGRFYGEGDMVKLKEKPERPPEFAHSDSYKLWPQMKKGAWGFWTKNMYWSYPGLDQIYWSCIAGYPCLCANCQFDTDLYGRSFVPKAYAFTVGVVDTNGNRVCEIGRYGNADTHGPGSAVKIGGPEIAVAHCSYLAVHSDKWLYLSDDGNARVLRVRLGYHAEERVPVPKPKP